MRTRRLCLLAVLVFCGTVQSRAAVFYDLFGFNSATQSYTSAGSEDFETLFAANPGSMTDISGLNGQPVNSALGLVLSAESGLLAGISAGFLPEADSNSVWDEGGSSLVLSLSPTLGRAGGVSLNVLSYSGVLPSNVQVEFRDEYDVLINTAAISGSTPSSSSGFIGFVPDGGESISKIVIRPLDGGTAVGVDNIYAVTPVPEPGWAGLGAGVFAIGIALIQRWRRTR